MPAPWTMAIESISHIVARGHAAPGHECPIALSTHGFTLLEVMVALAVLGFLLVSISQGIHFGLLTWNTETRLTSGDEDLDTLDDTLRRAIAQMVPGDDLDPAPFSGSPDHLDCITALPTAASPIVNLHMQATLMVDPAHRLILRWRPYLHAQRIGPPPASQDTELVQGAAGIDLAYWRPGGGWTSAWNLPRLPALIRIHVRFSPSDPRHWPDIVAAPRLVRP